MQVTNMQWVVKVDGAGDYSMFNPGPGGDRQFYMVIPGQYGQPIIIAEPDLAFSAPANLTYVNVKGECVEPAEKIAGIICQDGPRLSLTRAKNTGVLVKVNDDGSIQVGDEVWWIATLFSKDKNRIIGYDAFLVRKKPSQVKMRELGDIDLFS